jgi:hypothetical protein
MIDHHDIKIRKWLSSYDQGDLIGDLIWDKDKEIIQIDGLIGD